MSLVADCAMAFYDVAANDWTGDAVYDCYEDVNGETDRHIFNADWCIVPWDDPDYNGDNVKSVGLDR